MEICIFSTQAVDSKLGKVTVVDAAKAQSTQTLKEIAEKATSTYTLLALGQKEFTVGQNAISRMTTVIEECQAEMVYVDYFEEKDGKRINHPTIDYQIGSLRNDFDFGVAFLVKTETLKAWAQWETAEYQSAGLYAFRLFASRKGELVHLQEPLFTQKETDLRKSGEKMFDYVSDAARVAQIEFEKACTVHLKEINGLVEGPFKGVEFTEEFEYEASVVIPVFNRIKTVEDAVVSVLKQKTNFKFNLIVVDNYSTDGTSELLAKYAAEGKLIHHKPERRDLGIGGCWNEAINHPKCGRFAVQLDSDDMYSDEHTVQTVVDKFHADKCAMVIGSYKMTDFDLNEIPPGIVDHKEWTDDNGPNNALRINGLGAPRAFYTPILREIPLPNTSYGEDYALGIRLSREYKIGRIYDPIYLCRRWDDNSDASLDYGKLNLHNMYKDKLRSIELAARLNK